MNNLTVLVLAAGTGTRMGPFSRLINKCLVPYKDKALISHIFEKFPNNTKFVVACGYKSEQVKNYISNVHFDKDIKFVDVPDYSENITGPATTIQYCANVLPEKFIWISCDTLFDFDYCDKLNHNWIAVYPVNSDLSSDYCWIKRDGEKILKVCDKQSSKTAVDAFIGLMYVNDSRYINKLKQNEAKEAPSGFDGIDLRAYTVSNWLDFGTYDKWHKLNSLENEVSFPKPNEIFYKDNNFVIKFFQNVHESFNRAFRASINMQCMPKHVRNIKNFLIHDWVNGDILYHQLNPDIFKKMLKWCSDKLWKLPPDYETFSNKITTEFYKDKTYNRLDQFRIGNLEWCELSKVNDCYVKPIDYYLESIQWKELIENAEWRFIHGDLHFDNTIYNPATDEFTCIDWRGDFAGSMYGDIYYDLAKLLGGIYLNYRDIKNNKVRYCEDNNCVRIDIPRVKDYQVYETILKEWVINNNLSWKKVQLLVPIIYLNMSPLHDKEFGKFLIALSQLYFSKLYV